MAGYPLRLNAQSLILPLIFILALFSAVPGLTQEPRQKLPIPDSASQLRAEKLVRQLFSEEYGKTRSAELLIFAGKLLSQARDTKDDVVARFVLYRESRDIAAKAGDPARVLLIVDEMAREYVISVPAMKATALEKASFSVLTQPGNMALTEAALAAAYEPVEADDYEAAMRLARVANTGAAKVNNTSLTQAVESRTKSIEVIRQEYRNVKSAMEALANDPKDGSANLAVGKLLCFFKGNWDLGLPLLAQGSDPKLKALAAKDLSVLAEAAARVEVGDAWWDLAQEDKSTARSQLLRRAGYWYGLAIPQLTGLTKTKAEQRLKDIRQQVPEPQHFVGLIHKFQVEVASRRAAFSPDGRSAVVSCWDRRLHWLDLPGKRELYRFPQQNIAALGVAFAPDGKQVVSGDKAAIRFWELAIKREHRQFAVPEKSAWDVAFSHDGRLIATGGGDNLARLWDPKTGKAIRIFSGHTGPIWSIAFNPDDSRLLTASSDNTARVWDVSTGKEISRFEGHTTRVSQAVFSSVGHAAFSAGDAGAVRMWDVATGKEMRGFEGHAGSVRGVAVSPDGQRLLSCGNDLTIRLWDVATTKELHRFEGHTDLVISVVFSPDGRTALSCSDDKTVRLWALPK
jgi:hypothetical protein